MDFHGTGKMFLFGKSCLLCEQEEKERNECQDEADDFKKQSVMPLECGEEDSLPQLIRFSATNAGISRQLLKFIIKKRRGRYHSKKVKKKNVLDLMLKAFKPCVVSLHDLNDVDNSSSCNECKKFYWKRNRTHISEKLATRHVLETERVECQLPRNCSAGESNPSNDESESNKFIDERTCSTDSSGAFQTQTTGSFVFPSGKGRFPRVCCSDCRKCKPLLPDKDSKEKCEDCIKKSEEENPFPVAVISAGESTSDLDESLLESTNPTSEINVLENSCRISFEGTEQNFPKTDVKKCRGRPRKYNSEKSTGKKRKLKEVVDFHQHFVPEGSLTNDEGTTRKKGRKRRRESMPDEKELSIERIKLDVFTFPERIQAALITKTEDVALANLGNVEKRENIQIWNSIAKQFHVPVIEKELPEPDEADNYSPAFPDTRGSAKTTTPFRHRRGKFSGKHKGKSSVGRSIIKRTERAPERNSTEENKVKRARKLFDNDYEIYSIDHDGKEKLPADSNHPGKSKISENLFGQFEHDYCLKSRDRTVAETAVKDKEEERNAIEELEKENLQEDLEKKEEGSEKSKEKFEENVRKKFKKKYIEMKIIVRNEKCPKTPLRNNFGEEALKNGEESCGKRFKKTPQSEAKKKNKKNLVRRNWCKRRPNKEVEPLDKFAERLSENVAKGGKCPEETEKNEGNPQEMSCDLKENLVVLEEKLKNQIDQMIKIERKRSKNLGKDLEKTLEDRSHKGPEDKEDDLEYLLGKVTVLEKENSGHGNSEKLPEIDPVKDVDIESVVRTVEANLEQLFFGTSERTTEDDEDTVIFEEELETSENQEEILERILGESSEDLPGPEENVAENEGNLVNVTDENSGKPENENSENEEESSPDFEELSESEREEATEDYGNPEKKEDSVKKAQENLKEKWSSSSLYFEKNSKGDDAEKEVFENPENLEGGRREALEKNDEDFVIYEEESLESPEENISENLEETKAESEGKNLEFQTRDKERNFEVAQKIHEEEEEMSDNEIVKDENNYLQSVFEENAETEENRVKERNSEKNPSLVEKLQEVLRKVNEETSDRLNCEILGSKDIEDDQKNSGRKGNSTKQSEENPGKIGKMILSSAYYDDLSDEDCESFNEDKREIVGGIAQEKFEETRNAEKEIFENPENLEEGRREDLEKNDEDFIIYEEESLESPEENISENLEEAKAESREENLEFPTRDAERNFEVVRKSDEEEHRAEKNLGGDFKENLGKNLEEALREKDINFQALYKVYLKRKNLGIPVNRMNKSFTNLRSETDCEVIGVQRNGNKIIEVITIDDDDDGNKEEVPESQPVDAEEEGNGAKFESEEIVREDLAVNLSEDGKRSSESAKEGEVDNEKEEGEITEEEDEEEQKQEKVTKEDSQQTEKNSTERTSEAKRDQLDAPTCTLERPGKVLEETSEKRSPRKESSPSPTKYHGKYSGAENTCKSGEGHQKNNKSDDEKTSPKEKQSSNYNIFIFNNNIQKHFNNNQKPNPEIPSQTGKADERDFKEEKDNSSDLFKNIKDTGQFVKKAVSYLDQELLKFQQKNQQLGKEIRENSDDFVKNATAFLDQEFIKYLHKNNSGKSESKEKHLVSPKKSNVSPKKTARNSCLGKTEKISKGDSKIKNRVGNLKDMLEKTYGVNIVALYDFYSKNYRSEKKKMDGGAVPHTLSHATTSKKSPEETSKNYEKYLKKTKDKTPPGKQVYNQRLQKYLEWEKYHKKINQQTKLYHNQLLRWLHLNVSSQRPGNVFQGEPAVTMEAPNLPSFKKVTERTYNSDREESEPMEFSDIESSEDDDIFFKTSGANSENSLINEIIKNRRLKRAS